MYLYNADFNGNIKKLWVLLLLLEKCFKLALKYLLKGWALKAFKYIKALKALEFNVKFKFWCKKYKSQILFINLKG
jgi:hypothetical protein